MNPANTKVTNISTVLSQLQQDLQEDEGTRPESGLHFVLYNEQMDVVEANTGILPVDDRINRIQDLSSDRIIIQESGYLKVYVNNEAQTPVYYDNLVVMQSTGNVIEVNAYYPYGKIIQGLSTSSTYGKNNYKYNGKELQPELELNWLDYGARMLDGPRWFVPDPLAEKYYGYSPYVYVRNNPIRFIDLYGLKDTVYVGGIDQPVNEIPGTETPINRLDEEGRTIPDATTEGGNALHPDASKAYNCHSFVWENSQGDPTDTRNARLIADGIDKWDQNPDNNMMNYTQLDFNDPNKTGDRVVYYSDANDNGKYDSGEQIVHSAIVESVDKKGNTTTVISKMGVGGISINHPRAPGYYDYYGLTSRAYFRSATGRQTIVRPYYHIGGPPSLPTAQRDATYIVPKMIRK